MARKTDQLPIDKKIAELDEQRAATVAAIIEMDKQNPEGAAAQNEYEIRHQALKLVDGVIGLDDVEPPGPAPSEGDVRLTALIRKRDILIRALAIANLRRAQDHSDHVEKIMAGPTGDEWRTLARQAALALVTVRRADKAFEKLLAELKERAPAGAHYNGFGVRMPIGLTHAALDFVEDALKTGLITRKEIEGWDGKTLS